MSNKDDCSVLTIDNRGIERSITGGVCVERSITEAFCTPNEIVNNSDQTDIFLYMMADYCNQQSQLHEKSRIRFRIFNHSLALPAIILSTIAGSVNLITAVNELESNSYGSATGIIATICGICGLLSAAMISVHRYANLSELEQSHSYFVDAFERQNIDIRSNIVISRTTCCPTFTNKFEYLKHCKNELSMLVDKSPPVPTSIRNEYQRFKTLIDITHMFR